MNRSASDTPHPLTPDDPRLSEWIDGRLDDREAAEIERAVRGSAALGRAVEELRAVKAMLGRFDAGQPPAGFVRGVMEAIAGPRTAADDDDAVAQEWWKLETERITEERLEAREDVADAAAAHATGRWPWLAFAGALAAGVLVAVGLNVRTGDQARDVALAPAEPDRDAWAIPAAKETAAGAPPAAAAPAANVAADTGLVEAAPEEIEVLVAGPEDRAVLDELLAALVHDGRRSDEELPQATDFSVRDRERSPAGRIEVVASAAAIDAFLAAVERPADGVGAARLRSRSGREGRDAAPRALAATSEEAGTPERRKAAAVETRSRRLVIRIVDGEEPRASRPADPPPAPAELEE